MIGTIIDKTLGIANNLTNGIIGSLDGSNVTNNGGYITTNSGYVGLTTGNFQTHLLPEWEIEASFTGVGDTSTGIQMGIFDKQVAGLRHALVIITAGSPNTVSFKVGATILFSANLPADFSLINFSVRVYFRDSVISITTIEGAIGSNGRKLHFKYGYNLNNGFSNPIGNFCVGNATGSIKITSFNVRCNLNTGMPILVMGDSISAGRKVLPVSLRWPDRLQDYYYNFSHNYTRKVYTCASPSAKTQHMLDLIPSVLVLAPQTVIVLIGDNDPSNDVASYATKLISLVNQLQEANIFVIVLAMTADRDDPHLDFSSYILTTLSSQVNAKLLMTIDTLSPMSLNNNPADGADTQYLNADGVHPNRAGGQLIASTVFNVLS
jgi:lysophospholipase L1-like esterase